MFRYFRVRQFIMKTKRKVDPVWVGLAVASVGTVITIEGVLWFSVPVAISGIAVVMAVPASWVLWTVAGMFLSLRARMGGSDRHKQTETSRDRNGAIIQFRTEP